jgi:hypothetical protein
MLGLNPAGLQLLPAASAGTTGAALKSLVLGWRMNCTAFARSAGSTVASSQAPCKSTMPERVGELLKPSDAK